MLVIGSSNYYIPIILINYAIFENNSFSIDKQAKFINKMALNLIVNSLFSKI